MFLLGHSIACAGEILTLTLLFQRFQSLSTWHLEEIAILYGILQISFAIGEGLGRGFESLSKMVKSGDFDRILMRPRSSLLQIAGSEIQLMRIGRLIQGSIVLGWALNSMDLVHPLILVQVIFCALCGACLFLGLSIIQAAICFWTTETLEIMHIFTHGGLHAGQYPLFIYKSWMQWCFTILVPLACVAYLPVTAILDKRSDPFFLPTWLGWGTPIAGIFFLIAAGQIWCSGIRRYTSTGS